MSSPNIEMLQVVASGLGELINDLVFVGGAVAELYPKNASLTDIRPTMDVDCVIELSSRIEYSELETKLRKKSFQNDTTPGAPICRWVYESFKVDIMPTDEKILGFSNLWYLEGIKNKIPKTLPDGKIIYVFPSELYLAAKFEAHKNRGGKDLRQSHDFEDIIYILDNCNDIVKDIKLSNFALRKYLKMECQNLLSNPDLIEGIECALPYGSGDERVDIIKSILSEIVDLDLNQD